MLETRTFTIVPAVTDHAATIVAFQRKLAEFCHADMSAFGIEMGTVRALIEDGKQSYIFLAMAEEKAIGFVLAHIIPLGWSGTRGLYIEDLFVEFGQRSYHGVGTALVQRVCIEAIELAREDGNASGAFVRLDTDMDDNEPAHNFYGSHLGMDDSHLNYRLSGQALIALANR